MKMEKIKQQKKKSGMEDENILLHIFIEILARNAFLAL